MRTLWFRACLTTALLVSCTRSDPWKVSHIQSGSTKFSSSRLCYHTPDMVNGLDLEFLSHEAANNLYLHVHSHPIKPFKGNVAKALIQIKTDGKTYSYIVTRHQGGQKLLLSEEAKARIVSLLEEGKNFELSTSGYSSIIPAESFTRKYPLLTTPPRFRNPLYSPLE